MSHFLRWRDAEQSVVLQKPWAAVMVQVDTVEHRLILDEDAFKVAKTGSAFAPLPADWPVFTEDEREVKVARGYTRYVSVETINPYHLIFDEPPEGGPLR